jgi:hypothetical protein
MSRTARSHSSDRPNHPQRRLLRARRERPRGRGTEQCDELAALLIELHALPHDELRPHRRISDWRRSVSGWSSCAKGPGCSRVPSEGRGCRSCGRSCEDPRGVVPPRLTPMRGFGADGSIQNNSSCLNDLPATLWQPKRGRKAHARHGRARVRLGRR